MNQGHLKLVLCILALGLASQAYSPKMAILCTSTENPSKLYVVIDTPGPLVSDKLDDNHNCGDAANEYCGLTGGDYVFTADLSLPMEMATDEEKRKNYVDTYSISEREGNGLTINHIEGEMELFSFHFKAGFRSQIASSNKTTVTVTVDHVTKGDSVFKLNCEKK